MAAAVLAAACTTPSYSACPVDLVGGVPAGAFEVCRDALQQRYGPLLVADEVAFLLQTDWVPSPDAPDERRASVFRQEHGATADLAVVVEVRRLGMPLWGLPRWTPARGDAAAERELAGVLRALLNP
ncbi:MAG: hypothetical protein KF830_11865 [Planctomycetes bacterium]|nr:hypothetical protein [Planctomycetota bacterium]